MDNVLIKNIKKVFFIVGAILFFLTIILCLYFSSFSTEINIIPTLIGVPLLLLSIIFILVGPYMGEKKCAIISFTVSILGAFFIFFKGSSEFIILFFLLPLFAIIFGLIGLSNRNNRNKFYIVISLIGIILGVVMLFLACLFLFY